jgi:hypothetical protein
MFAASETLRQERFARRLFGEARRDRRAAGPGRADGCRADGCRADG